MEINMHNVSSVEVSKIESLPSCKLMEVRIKSSDGEVISVLLYADSAEALKPVVNKHSRYSM